MDQSWSGSAITEAPADITPGTATASQLPWTSPADVFQPDEKVDLSLPSAKNPFWVREVAAGLALDDWSITYGPSHGVFKLMPKAPMPPTLKLSSLFLLFQLNTKFLDILMCGC